jgi:hypothetical protein
MPPFRLGPSVSLQKLVAVAHPAVDLRANEKGLLRKIVGEFEKQAHDLDNRVTQLLGKRWYLSSDPLPPSVSPPGITEFQHEVAERLQQFDCTLSRMMSGPEVLTASKASNTVIGSHSCCPIEENYDLANELGTLVQAVRLGAVRQRFRRIEHNLNQASVRLSLGTPGTGFTAA